MARQMTTSELQAFSANRPFTDLVSEDEEYFFFYFNKVMSRKLIEPAIPSNPIDDLANKGTGQDWF